MSDQRCLLIATGTRHTLSGLIFGFWCLLFIIILFCLHTISQDFFRKSGVAVMTVRELFDFVVDPTITPDLVDEYLEKVRDLVL